jgi:type IV pilus assembly protein PilQ
MKPMKSILKKSGLVPSFLVILIAMLALPQFADAQIVDPLREYTNPDEIVAFNRSTTYVEAIEIINTFSQEYEEKFIVDRSGTTGQIGVTLPAMHWKDALEYIMRFKNLELNEYPEYYEIVAQEIEPEEGAVQTAGRGQQGTGGQGEVLLPDLDTREVRINATFFEGNKQALQEIGIDWSTLTKNVPEAIGDFVGANGTQTVPETEFSDQFVSVNSFNAASVSQNAFNAIVNMGQFGPGISVQALFSAFEADNLGKILATPSIKVVDGEEGNFQVGQDFSIKQRDIAGNVTDNFQSTGTILNVVPRIISQGDTSFVYIELKVERSTVQPDVVSTIINTQEATTTAILLDGEATYVGGLYSTEESNVRRGVPILKDLPGWFFGLKYLFGYNSKDYSENELIIIVQAEIIEPVRTRFSSPRLTGREVLNQTRDGMRTSLDRVFSMDDPEPILEEGESEPPVVEEADRKEQPVEVHEEELTEEQKNVADELSMPVQNPELMVVVPKAFNLEQFLNYQAGIEEKDFPAETKTDLKYFVIAGSFLVPSNADNFSKSLREQGYETQILFNPETRFNYVAYEGYADFDRAAERTIEIRNSFNSDAWMFTLPLDAN